MRRLLVVSYFFPPVGGVGTERTLKHVTYLPDFGWRCAVVGPANSGYRIVDRATLARIPPGTEVFRARGLEPSHVRRTVARLLRRRSMAGPPRSDPGDEPREPRPRQGAAGARRIANAAWRFAVPLLFFPDDQVLWLPGAYRAGMRARAAGPVDAVLSSSPPITGHLAAGRLARRMGVPWVADFRDPWIGNAFARPLPAPHRLVQRELERWIVENATRVVLATERMLEQFASRYPDHRDRLVHLPNGYDLAELEAAPDGSRAEARQGTFRIVYAGSVYGDRELSVFLDGVELLLARRPDLREALRVDFVGWLSTDNQAIAQWRFAPLEPVVRYLGYLPRPEAIAQQRSADAGLVLLADGPGRDAVATGKLYEYIGLDLPILAVVPPGEVRAVLDGLDWGVVADPTPDGVAGGIEAIVDAPHPRGRTVDRARRYERRVLAGNLGGLLDQITDRR